MSTCPKCGVEVAAGTAFCPACGSPIAVQQAPQQSQQAPQQPQQAPQQPQQAPQQPYQQAYQQAYNAAASAEDHTAEIDPMDIQQNKAMGILSYFGILVLIPIFAAPQSRFARFHANQGLFLLIVEAALGILNAVVNALGRTFWGALAPWAVVLTVILDIVWVAAAVFAIMGIVYAAQGKAKELPIIGKIKILK